MKCRRTSWFVLYFLRYVIGKAYLCTRIENTRKDEEICFRFVGFADGFGHICTEEGF